MKTRGILFSRWGAGLVPQSSYYTNAAGETCLAPCLPCKCCGGGLECAAAFCCCGHLHAGRSDCNWVECVLPVCCICRNVSPSAASRAASLFQHLHVSMGPHTLPGPLSARGARLHTMLHTHCFGCPHYWINGPCVHTLHVAGSSRVKDWMNKPLRNWVWSRLQRAMTRKYSVSKASN